MSITAWQPVGERDAERIGTCTRVECPNAPTHWERWAGDIWEALCDDHGSITRPDPALEAMRRRRAYKERGL